ncbi:MAG: tetratricopeptide repeat protein [Thermodesulfovibrionia bacterium]|nr:tetratricopeptide repeat protein [Thermodesulfovibrionia bacterium]
MKKKYHTIPYPAFVLSALLSMVLLSACATTPSAEDRRKSEAQYKLGVSYLNESQLNEAYIKFQEALQLNPQNKRSLNALGHISTRFKEYDEAVSYYKRAISIDPHYSDALNNLGVTFLELEKWDEAAKYFKMALKNPLYFTPEKAHLNFGYALYKKGDYREAEKTLKESLIKYPESSRPAYILGLVYINLGRIEEAIDVLNKTVDLVPDYIDAHWELANAYLRVGDNKKALKHFRMVAENGNNSEKSKKALAYIELLRDNPD